MLCSSCGVDGEKQVASNDELSLLSQDLSNELFPEDRVLNIEVIPPKIN